MQEETEERWVRGETQGGLSAENWKRVTVTSCERKVENVTQRDGSYKGLVCWKKKRTAGGKVADQRRRLDVHRHAVRGRV